MIPKIYAKIHTRSKTLSLKEIHLFVDNINSSHLLNGLCRDVSQFANVKIL